MALIEIGGRSQVLDVFGRSFVWIFARLQCARSDVWQACLEYRDTSARLLLRSDKYPVKCTNNSE